MSPEFERPSSSPSLFHPASFELWLRWAARRSITAPGDASLAAVFQDADFEGRARGVWTERYWRHYVPVPLDRNVANLDSALAAIMKVEAQKKHTRKSKKASSGSTPVHSMASSNRFSCSNRSCSSDV